MGKKANPVNNFNIAKKIMELVDYMEKYRPNEKVTISKDGFNFIEIENLQIKENN